MRAAARLLLEEAAALRPILEAAPRDGFDIETVCTGWTVRDVLAHCGAALSMTASGRLHDFGPESNERDVDERRSWVLDDVLTELYQGYTDAAAAIDEAGGRLDGIGLGEWMHGGDVREALGVGEPYASEGIGLAVELLFARGAALRRPGIEVDLGEGPRRFGVKSGDAASAVTDIPTFVRLCGGRNPDPARYELRGCSEADFVVFN